MAYYDAAYNYIGDTPGVAVPMLRRIFDSNHFRPKANQRNSFVLVPGKNRTKLCMLVANVLLTFRLSCPTYKE